MSPEIVKGTLWGLGGILLIALWLVVLDGFWAGILVMATLIFSIAGSLLTWLDS